MKVCLKQSNGTHHKHSLPARPTDRRLPLAHCTVMDTLSRSGGVASRSYRAHGGGAPALSACAKKPRHNQETRFLLAPIDPPYLPTPVTKPPVGEPAISTLPKCIACPPHLPPYSKQSVKCKSYMEG
jgi:hypothetical protein